MCSASSYSHACRYVGYFFLTWLWVSLDICQEDAFIMFTAHILMSICRKVCGMECPFVEHGSCLLYKVRWSWHRQLWLRFCHSICHVITSQTEVSFLTQWNWTWFPTRSQDNSLVWFVEDRQVFLGSLSDDQTFRKLLRRSSNWEGCSFMEAFQTWTYSF